MPRDYIRLGWGVDGIPSDAERDVQIAKAREIIYGKEENGMVGKPEETLCHVMVGASKEPFVGVNAFGFQVQTHLPSYPVWWIRDTPHGHCDWEWTDDKDKAVKLTGYWQARFLAWCRRDSGRPNFGVVLAGGENGMKQYAEQLRTLAGFVQDQINSPTVKLIRSRLERIASKLEHPEGTPLRPVAEIRNWCVIIRAIWERGAVQAEALEELKRRGLWLSDEQKVQAGLKEERKS